MAGSLLALPVLHVDPVGAWLSRPSSSGCRHGQAPSSLSLNDKSEAVLVNIVGTQARQSTAAV